MELLIGIMLLAIRWLKITGRLTIHTLMQMVIDKGNKAFAIEKHINLELQEVNLLGVLKTVILIVLIPVKRLYFHPQLSSITIPILLSISISDLDSEGGAIDGSLHWQKVLWL